MTHQIEKLLMNKFVAFIIMDKSFDHICQSYGGIVVDWSVPTVVVLAVGFLSSRT